MSETGAGTRTKAESAMAKSAERLSSPTPRKAFSPRYRYVSVMYLLLYRGYLKATKLPGGITESGQQAHYPKVNYMLFVEIK